MTRDVSNIDADLSPADIAFTTSLRAMPTAPSPMFRGALQTWIATVDPGYGPRPSHLWLRSISLIAVGLLLIGAAVLI